VLRDARFYDNQTWDIVVFSILDHEMTRERQGDGFPSFGLWDERP
jgi:hypothetical protein